MFKKELVVLDKKFSNYEEIFKHNFTLLRSFDIVKESYLDAIIEREKEFPTGLKTNVGINIAMPHTDVAHANEEAILFMRLTDEVEFSEMVDPDEKVNTKLIFNMVVKDPKNQIESLTKLMKLFQNRELMEYLLIEKDEERIVNELEKFIRQGV